jgi:hypothetical protein
MTDKLYLWIAVGITIFFIALNFLMVPYLLKTTSGGEQAPFTFIAYSIVIFAICQILLLVIYAISKPKKRYK